MTDNRTAQVIIIILRNKKYYERKIVRVAIQSICHLEDAVGLLLASLIKILCVQSHCAIALT